MAYCKIEEGFKLVAEDSSIRNIFLVVDGSFEIFNKDNFKKRIQNSEFIGEFGCITKSKNSFYEAVALKKSHVWSITSFLQDLVNFYYLAKRND